MAKRPKNSEAELLERYRIALENTTTQPQIATALEELGYNPEKITEGKTLWAQTRSVYNANKAEDDETSEAYAKFAEKKAQLEETFTRHRKKAKVVFRTDALTAEKLGIAKALPRSYVKWLETAKQFYALATTDTTIQTQLTRLKITPDALTAAQNQIVELETARANYLREKGESQDSTQAKDAVFNQLHDWMSEFYAVAKIGLEEQPQLLEALGKTVKA